MCSVEHEYIGMGLSLKMQAPQRVIDVTVKQHQPLLALLLMLKRAAVNRHNTQLRLRKRCSTAVKEPRNKPIPR